MTSGIILFSYNMLYERSHLTEFYSHLFHGRIPEGFVERKEREYAGFGYTDPLTHYTNSIARGLKAMTGYNVYHGCKHSHPFIEEAVDQLIIEGVTTLYMLSLSPLVSKTGTLAYEQKVQKLLAERAPYIKIISLNGYSTHPGFIQLVAGQLMEAAGYIRHRQPKVIFTSHSLPGTDNSNKDFIRQYQKLAHAIMTYLPQPYEYRLAYRSIGLAEQKWLRPDILDVLQEEKEAGTEAIIVGELLSVVENREVIEEIGQEAKQFALDNGMEFIQARYLNDSYDFVTFLKSLM